MRRGAIFALPTMKMNSVSISRGCHEIQKYLTAELFWKRFSHKTLKGHSQLWDRAHWTLVFSLWKKFTPTWNQSSSRTPLNFRSVLLDFQTFFEKPVIECPFVHPMTLFLSYLVKNVMDRYFVVCKLAMKFVSNAHECKFTAQGYATMPKGILDSSILFILLGSQCIWDHSLTFIKHFWHVENIQL